MEIDKAMRVVDTTMKVTKIILEDVAPKVQESVKGFSERLLVLAEKYPSIEEFAQKLNKVADVTHDVLYALGVDVEPVEVIGEKIATAEKGVNEFDSTEEYLNYIQNDVQIDAQKEENVSIGEKLAHIITGLAFVIEILSEKLDMEIPEPIVDIAMIIVQLENVDMGATTILSILNKLKESGIDNLNDVYECILGTGDSDRIKTGEILFDIFNDIYPGHGEDILNDIIDEARE